MNAYDKSPRLLMTNALVQVASLASSSLWFALSVATLLVAIIFPLVKGQSPSTTPHPPTEATTPVRTKSRSPSRSAPTSVVVPRDGHYRISLDNATGVVRRTVAKGPSAITIIPPISGAITITAHPDRSSVAITATPNPSIPEEALPEHPRETADAILSAPASPKATSSSLEGSGNASDPSTSQEAQGNSSPAKRLPSMFRRKAKRSSQDNQGRRRSASRSLSPIRALLPDMRHELSEPADVHGRIPYKPIPDEHEMLQTKFVNPFKSRKSKSRRNSLASAPGTPETNSCGLPQPSSSPVSTPRRLLASYINRAMRPLHDAAIRSPSPRRWSLSSSATSSEASSSSNNSFRSFSPTPCSPRPSTANERPPPRTQPYGAPYFAPMPMPMPRPTSRRSSSGRVTIEVKETICEDEESEGQEKSNLRRANTVARSTAVEDENMLGATLGQETTRHRRYHSLDFGAKASR